MWRVWGDPFSPSRYEWVVYILPPEGDEEAIITDGRQHYSPDNFVAPLPRGCSIEQPAAECPSLNEPSRYEIDAENYSNETVHFDLRILDLGTPEITKTKYVTTSEWQVERTITVTSTTTVTGYNTTYKRPLG